MIGLAEALKEEDLQLRQQINLRREELAQLCQKRMVPTTMMERGLSLASTTKNVMLANVMDSNFSEVDDEAKELYGYGKPTPKQLALASYQSLFDVGVTMLNPKSNIPQIPRTFTLNKNGLLRRRTDADYGVFAPKVELAMSKAREIYDKEAALLEKEIDDMMTNGSPNAHEKEEARVADLSSALEDAGATMTYMT